MKTIHALVLTASFASLAGCSTTPPEPGPGPSPTTGASTSGPRPLGAMPGDVAPTKLTAGTPQRGVGLAPASVSFAVAPEPIQFAGPETFTTTDERFDVAPGSRAQTVTVPVDETDGASYVFLGVNGSDPATVEATLRGVQVFDAAGARVNLREGQVSEGNALPMASMPIHGRPAGLWTVKVSAAAANAGVSIDVRQPISTTTMALRASVAEHLLGNAHAVDMTFADDGHPIAGAVVVGTLLGPDLEPEGTVTFNEVGNGVYRADTAAALGASPRAGSWLVDVQATGINATGKAVTRTGKVGFHVGVPTASFVGAPALRIVRDSRGSVAWVEADVHIQSASLDRYEVSGMLTALGADGSEHEVAGAQVGLALDAGQTVVTLRFDAGHVRLTRLDGVLALRNLTLFSMGTNTLLQRVSSGFNVMTPSIPRADLAQPSVTTPAIDEMIAEGVLFRD
jgi:hypothetical protein